MQKIFLRFFHLREMMFLLSLCAVMCLPIALQDILRDANVNLLVPVALLGMLFASFIAFWNLNKVLTSFLLLTLSPLTLFIHLGRMWFSIFEFLKQLFYAYLSIYSWLISKTQLDFSLLISAWQSLSVKIVGFAERIGIWLINVLQGVQLEDPIARTFIWNIGILLISIWAGWQIVRYERYLIGILPSTILLAFILDYTRKEISILWIHLILLLFLFGITQFWNIHRRWISSGIDYSDSTMTESMVILSILVMQLFGISYFASTISIKDILENFRDKQASAELSQVEAFGLEPDEENSSRSPVGGSGFSVSHEIQAGPQLSNQVVMIISTGDLPPLPVGAQPNIPRYYWRTQTYQTYTGLGWINPSIRREEISANQFLFEQPESGYRVVHQEVIFNRGIQSQLYWTGNLLNANVPFEAVWLGRDANNLFLHSKMLTALINERSYEADSLLINIDAQSLRKAPAIYPNWISENYLALPESVPQRVRELARDLTISEKTPYERALAIQNYLREFPYTLDVPAPPSGRDAVDYFLFDLRQGYCDYYATAMVVMARSVGLPARIVLGYSSGSYDIEQAKYFVAEKDAHSWVEIYFADIGWVEFEPTPSQPAPIYGEAVASTELNEQTQPVQSLNRPFFSFFKNINWLLPTLFVIIFLIIWIIWDIVSFIWLEPAFVIQRLYNRLRRLAQPLSGFSPPHETAHQYALALTQKIQSLHTSKYLQTSIYSSCIEVNQLTNLYSQSLFAPQPTSQQDAQIALRTWRRLRWKIMVLNLLVQKKRRVQKK